jgi:hypothetical protein
MSIEDRVDQLERKDVSIWSLTRALISLVPKMVHDVVDFFHLQGVILHDGTDRKKMLVTILSPRVGNSLVKCFRVLLEVAVCHIGHLYIISVVWYMDTSRRFVP